MSLLILLLFIYFKSYLPTDDWLKPPVRRSGGARPLPRSSTAVLAVADLWEPGTAAPAERHGGRSRDVHQGGVSLQAAQQRRAGPRWQVRPQVPGRRLRSDCGEFCELVMPRWTVVFCFLLVFFFEGITKLTQTLMGVCQWTWTNCRFIPPPPRPLFFFYHCLSCDRSSHGKQREGEKKN